MLEMKKNGQYLHHALTHDNMTTLKLVLRDGTYSFELEPLQIRFGLFELFDQMQTDDDNSINMSDLPLTFNAITYLMKLSEHGELDTDEMQLSLIHI
jgi:hypothetical protein